MPEDRHVEQELVFDWADLTLTGTLALPTGEGRRPAVLMMQGSGPADRDSGGFFPPVRSAFLERGLATFAFDKPGCGGSSGHWRDHGLNDRADQASAAIDLLGGHPAIDSARIGIWGHSQGGWLAQILAGRHPDLAFAVANSGPSIPVVDQDLFATEHTLRAEGFPEDSIDQALTFVCRLHQAARDDMAWADVERRVLRAALHEPWSESVIGPVEAADWRFLRILIAEDHQPLDALRRIRCPFLAIYGGLDVLVPAWRGAEESGLAMQRGGTHDSTVVVFPGGDHRMSDPATGSFVPGYLELLGDWCARRVDAGRGIADGQTDPTD